MSIKWNSNPAIGWVAGVANSYKRTNIRSLGVAECGDAGRARLDLIDMVQFMELGRSWR